MPVYIIQAGNTDMVKIGWATQDSESRLKGLQCAHYESLRIIREIDGKKALEGWFHRRFAAERVRSEWFHLVPEMLTIEPPPASVKASKATNTEASRIIEVLGGSRNVATALKLKQNTVCQWYRDGIASRHWLPLARHAAELGVRISVNDIEKSWQEMRPAPQGVAVAQGG